jgi:hypothetical protein
LSENNGAFPCVTDIKYLESPQTEKTSEFDNQSNHLDKNTPSAVDTTKGMARSYLIHFFSEIDWIDFRYLELDALLELNHLNPSSVYNIEKRHQAFRENDPFLRIHSISEEQILKICQRSVLIKHVYELWGGMFLLSSSHPDSPTSACLCSSEGQDLNDCIENIQKNSLELIEMYQNSSWAIYFDAYRSTLHLPFIYPPYLLF